MLSALEIMIAVAILAAVETIVIIAFLLMWWRGVLIVKKHD